MIIQRLLYKTGATSNPVQLLKGKTVLEDYLKLNEYRITETDTLEARKPYIGLTVENNYGNKIYWRLDRKDTIREVKVKLASAQSSLAAVSPQVHFSFNSDWHAFRW